MHVSQTPPRQHPARLIAALCALLALGACTSVNTFPRDTLQYVFAIDANYEPHPYAIRFGTTLIGADQYNVTNHLRQIVNGIRTSGRTNILIYLFGGLSSVADTVNRAAVLSEVIRTNSAYYPICVGGQ